MERAAKRLRYDGGKTFVTETDVRKIITLSQVSVFEKILNGSDIESEGRKALLYQLLRADALCFFRMILMQRWEGESQLLTQLLSRAIECGRFKFIELLLNDPRTTIPLLIPKPRIRAVCSNTITSFNFLFGHALSLCSCVKSWNDYPWLKRQYENWTFTKENWRYFPQRKRKVYMDFLVSLKRLGIAPYFRDLHDTILPYFMSKIKIKI